MIGTQSDFQAQRRAFIHQHIASFASGLCIGGVVSNSIQGAIAGACFHTLFASEIDGKTQMAAAAAFACIKYTSQHLFNRELTVFTPLVLSLINTKLAAATVFSSVGSLLFTPGIGSHLSASIIDAFANTNLHQLYLKSTWASLAEDVGKIFEYRIAQGVGFLLAWEGLTRCSKIIGQRILQLHILKQTPSFRIFHPAIIRLGVESISYLCVAIASAKGVNYITGKKFGDFKTLIPVLIFISSMGRKYRNCLLNARRDGPTLHLHHPAELHGALRSTFAENEEDQTRIEELAAQEISRIQIEVSRILSSFRDRVPSDTEINQLKKHIAQLKIQLDKKPDDTILRKFLESAESRLENIVNRKRLDY